MSQDTADLFERGRAYVNVHTAKNAAGEIRGQLKLLNHSTTTTTPTPDTGTTTTARPRVRRPAARVLGRRVACPDRPVVTRRVSPGRETPFARKRNEVSTGVGTVSSGATPGYP